MSTAAFKMPDLIRPPIAPRPRTWAVVAFPFTCAPVAAAAAPAAALMPRSNTERPTWMATGEVSQTLDEQVDSVVGWHLPLMTKGYSVNVVSKILWGFMNACIEPEFMMIKVHLCVVPIATR